jgi:hypothetical protein
MYGYGVLEVPCEAGFQPNDRILISLHAHVYGHTWGDVRIHFSIILKGPTLRRSPGICCTSIHGGLSAVRGAIALYDIQGRLLKTANKRSTGKIDMC